MPNAVSHSLEKLRLVQDEQPVEEGGAMKIGCRAMRGRGCNDCGSLGLLLVSVVSAKKPPSI